MVGLSMMVAKIALALGGGHGIAFALNYYLDAKLVLNKSRDMNDRTKGGNDRESYSKSLRRSVESDM